MIKRFCSLLAVAVLAAGCTNQYESAVEQAAAAPTGAIAYEIIQESYDEAKDDLLCAEGCRQMLREKLSFYRQRAEDELNPRFLLNLFINGGIGDEASRRKKRLFEAAVQRVDERSDPVLFLAIAKAYEQGNFIPANEKLQQAYLKRAYESGSTSASGELFKLHRKRGELVDAYYWGLRCTGSCRHSLRQHIEAVEVDLSTEDRDRLQANAAKDAKGPGGLGF